MAGLTLLAGLLPLQGSGQDSPPAAKDEKLIQALFECDNESALKKAISSAQKAGIPQQAILEARFVFLVDQEDFSAVAAMGPVLKEQKASFRIDDSVIFSVEEEFFSVVEYCYALGALETGDPAGFKRHITEAFWLSPRQASAFAPHIEGLRRERALADLRIDFNQNFPRQKDRKKASLKALSNNSEHLILHFWSPWSNESEAHLPDFLSMVEELNSHGLPVVSVLIEPGNEALSEARKFRSALPAEKSGEWVVDNSQVSLARKLRVLELPTISVLKVDGSVLFSGHPSEKQLWSTLQTIDPKIERPRVEPAR